MREQNYRKQLRFLEKKKEIVAKDWEDQREKQREFDE